MKVYIVFYENCNLGISKFVDVFASNESAPNYINSLDEWDKLCLTIEECDIRV